MEDHIAKLLELSSEAISNKSTAPLPGRWQGQLNGPIAELRDLLVARNGFYSFESALHVRSTSGQPGVHSLESWNDVKLWKHAYGARDAEFLCFAEDVFGVQFAIHDSEVVTFDPETGGFSFFASSLNEWAGHILFDYDVVVGAPIAHAWQTRFGDLAAGFRLVPTIPFVLGGEFEVSNLRATPEVEGMLVRASIAEQIANLPDGTRIVFGTSD